MTTEDKEFRNDNHRNFYMKFWGKRRELREEIGGRPVSSNKVLKSIMRDISDEELWERCTDIAHQDASSASWEGINIDVQKLTQELFEDDKEMINEWQEEELAQFISQNFKEQIKASREARLSLEEAKRKHKELDTGEPFDNLAWLMSRKEK